MVGIPSRTKTGHLARVRTDDVGEGRIVGGLLGDHAFRCERELTAVAAGTTEKWRQALAHATDFGSLIEVGVHARNMLLQLGGQLWRRRLSGGAHTAGDVLDDAVDFVVPHDISM
jgi:hypothetical protein